MINKINFKTFLKELPELNFKEDRFNIMNLMFSEVLRKEEMQSKILSRLLNFNNNDSYTDIPLRLFIEHLNKFSKINIDSSKIINNTFKIEIERPVKVIYADKKNQNKRIDILLSWEENARKKAIIIENKLNWAENQPNQLNDYYKCIKDEAYNIEAIVYMPYSSLNQHYKDTNAEDFVLEKTINFDAEKLIDWLQDTINKLSVKTNYKAQISELITYKTFLENLKSKNYQRMKAQEILNSSNKDLSYYDIIIKAEQLHKIVKTDSWCEAVFKKIIPVESFSFNDELLVNYKRSKSDRNYAQFYFKNSNTWLELWMLNNEIELYLVSYYDSTPKLKNFRINYNQFYKNYYYFTLNNKEKFKLDDKNLIKIVEEILIELKP